MITWLRNSNLQKQGTIRLLITGEVQIFLHHLCTLMFLQVTSVSLQAI